MTAPYTARSSQLFNGPGAPAAPAQPVDIGGAIEALAGGAGSIIHQTMLRKQAEFERTRQSNIDKQNQDRWTQELALQKQDRARQDAKERREFLMAGGVPEHDETQSTVTAQPAGSVPITPLNPITQAMGAGLGDKSQAASALAQTPSSLPGPQLISQNAPPVPQMSQPISAPASTSQTVHVPESYNPINSANYIRAAMVQDMRNQGYLTKAEHAAAQSKEHDDRVTARIESGQKPIMVRGNPFWDNGDGTLEPARYSDGRPVTVASVPQPPATPTKTPAPETIRNAQLKGMNDAMAQNEKDRAAQQKIVDSKPSVASTDDRKAARAKIAELEAQYALQKQKRDSTLGVQLTAPDSPAGSAPVQRKLGATPKPTPATGFTDDQVSEAMLVGGAKTSADVKAYWAKKKPQGRE